MNHIYRSIWCRRRASFVAVSEHVSAGGKQASAGAAGIGACRYGVFALKALAGSLLLWFGAAAQAAPVGGAVSAGSGSISRSGATTTINQSSQHLAIDWQGFNVAPQETVNFVQPSASALAVNRIFDTNGSQILGKINANGQVYLINPNGILFGAGSQVNVGGLVASTLDLNSVSANGTVRSFGGNGSGSVINHGAISAANGGYVALLGKQVGNHGSIVAPGGTVALGAGSAATLTFADNRLLTMQIDQNLIDTLAENGGLIRADGGTVLMSAGARDSLLASVVNNTGTIEARTVENRDGKIVLLGGMAAGTTNVAGTLDASAPNGGDGGFIDTSAARVNIADGARITTTAPHGKTGNWLIDPEDFIIAASGGNITGATLGTLLGSNSVTVQTGAGVDSATDLYGTAGSNGDIFVNDSVSWSANTLTLKAHRNVVINRTMNGSGDAKLAIEYGQSAQAAGNTATVTMGAPVNLSEGENYSTRLGSDGALKSYYVITSLGTADDVTSGAMTLQGMAAAANLGRNFALGANIDASETSAASGWRFTPIGDTGAGKAYTGSFDGLGHAITSLTIARPDSTNRLGLFGYTGGTATIANVGLRNVAFRGSSFSHVGGLVAHNFGAITNSYVEGTVGAGNSTTVGGLVGVNGNTGVIRNSYFHGNVIANNRGGGVAGINHGAISDVYAAGGRVTGSASQDFLGGLVGQNTGTIAGSYSAMGVYNTALNKTGKFVGVNTGTISNSYWDDSQSFSPGGMPGIAEGTTTGATALDAAGMMQQSSFAGWDFTNTWYAQEGRSAPLHRAFLTPLTVTANDATMTYDGAAYTDQSGVSFSFAHDASRLAGSIHYGAVSDAPVNVGTHTLDPSGYVTLQRGYIVSYVGGATLTVTPKVIDLAGTRVYDNGTGFDAGSFGNNGTISTGIGSQTLVVSGAGSVGSRNVSAGAQTLTLGTLAIGDGTGLASNYTLAGGTHTGTVTPKALTVSGITASDREYDGSTAATVSTSDMHLDGLLANDVVTVDSTGVFDTRHAGTGKTVNLTSSYGGSDVGNYTITGQSTTTATITPKALTVSGITADDKVYDGTTAATVSTSGVHLDGLLANDTVTVDATGVFDTRHAGTGKTVTLSSTYGGAERGNYTITGQSTTTAAITPKALTVSGITADDKVYDGTTVATVNAAGAHLAGLIAGDEVTLAASGLFADKNAGSGKTVNLSSTYGGADRGNYTIAGQDTATAAISRARLEVTGVAANNRPFDASVAATLRGTPVVAAFGSDDVRVAGDGRAVFADPAVGQDKAVTVSGFMLDGADAGNYDIMQPAGLSASIEPSELPLAMRDTSSHLYMDVLRSDLARIMVLSLRADTSGVFGAMDDLPQMGMLQALDVPAFYGGAIASPVIVALPIGGASQSAVESAVFGLASSASRLTIENGGVRLPLPASAQ